MKNEKIQEIKKEDKKALHKFALIILLSLVVGLFIGALSNMMSEDSAAGIAEYLLDFLKTFFPIANIVITVVFMFPIIYLYMKSRNVYRLWDGEDEDEMNKIEIHMSYALWFTAILLVFSFFFFAVGAYLSIHPYKGINKVDLIFWFAGFILAVACVNIAQQKIINFLKEINPEKRGSVYDLKFAKEWEKNCDEAEQLLIYKSAYTSYRTVMLTCLLLWLFCVIGANIWDFGLMPVTLISIVWLVQVSSYCIKSISLSNHFSKK
jgi:hypothetical protein